MTNELTEQRVLREAELVDWGQLPEILTFVGTAVASGVIGNAAYAGLKAKIDLFRQRTGDRGTAQLATGVLQTLREKDPYQPEASSKNRFSASFGTRGSILKPRISRRRLPRRGPPNRRALGLLLGPRRPRQSCRRPSSPTAERPGLSALLG